MPESDPKAILAGRLWFTGPDGPYSARDWHTIRRLFVGCVCCCSQLGWVVIGNRKGGTAVGTGDGSTSLASAHQRTFLWRITLFAVFVERT
jgi:hypothetical protein